MQDGALSGFLSCSRKLQSAARGDGNQTRDLPVTGRAMLPPELWPHKHKFTQNFIHYLLSMKIGTPQNISAASQLHSIAGFLGEQL